MGGQPRISERKSWRAPIVTEQGNPGIYVQIDEWLPLYKGNLYILDEIMGIMYLSKGEHLMWIVETASHRPFQDHELSISRHVPEKEYTEPMGRPAGEPTGMGREEDKLEPITPIAGIVGGTGRTPIPVAESTHQPPEREVYTSDRVPEGEGPGHRAESAAMGQIRREPAERDVDTQREKGKEWALPTPIESRRPPGGGVASQDISSQRADQLEEKAIGQEYPTPEQ